MPIAGSRRYLMDWPELKVHGFSGIITKCVNLMSFMESRGHPPKNNPGWMHGKNILDNEYRNGYYHLFGKFLFFKG
jgi:hypothetical protein